MCWSFVSDGISVLFLHIMADTVIVATLENDSGWHHIYRGCKYADFFLFLVQNKPLSRNCSNAMCLLILFVKKFTSVWQNASLFCQEIQSDIVLSGNRLWHHFVRELNLSLFCQGTYIIVHSSSLFSNTIWIPKSAWITGCMCGHVSDIRMNGSKQNPV